MRGKTGKIGRKEIPKEAEPCVYGLSYPKRVKGLAVMLYLLGLSYGATSLALEALGVYLCKSRIYDAVQETAKRVPGLKRDQVFAGVKTPALGGDLTSVKCKGEWLPLGITVDPVSGVALTIDA
jgi:transposase-like protein